MTDSEGKYADIHKALIDRCKKNDRLAYTELYRYFCKAIYNTCLRIVKNPDLAEDVMQEAFLTAFEKIATFKGDSTFGAWLKRIAVNKSIDEVRKNLSIFEPYTDILDNKIADSTDISAFGDPDQVHGKVELIKRAMHQLPDGYRLVLSLYLFEGYDHEEIAQILGITESTSRSQYTRARQKLTEILNLPHL
jgi:RNA polymerase sigma factor (sigma-70 family)